MTDYRSVFETSNNECLEDYNEVIKTIENMLKAMMEVEGSKEALAKYFTFVGKFYLDLVALESRLDENYFKQDIEILKAQNEALFKDILPEHYDVSYANPSYTTELFGEDLGKVLSFVYAEIRGCIVDAYEHRLYDITVAGELLVALYTYLFNTEDIISDEVIELVKNYARKYTPYLTELRIRELIDETLSYATDIIMESDLNDLRYLYKFGEYISHNEIEIAEYLNSLSEEKVQKMASTYTEAYKRGFIRDGKDLSKKKTVNIRYNIGFERVIKLAIKQFRAMGLEPIIYRYAVKSGAKNRHLRIGYTGTSANKQFDYDHRFDTALYLDEAYVDIKVEATKNALEKYRHQAKVLAGPALIEIFGEPPFAPKNKQEICRFSEEQEQMNLKMVSENQKIMNQYIPSDEISFTINAYPIPEIGSNFHAIFDETIQVNTLDSDKYEEVQQRLIDALDEATYVHVKGKGSNQTDIKVYLHPLKDPKKETKFENCVADVNVPVGEVFTSPVLKGTKGVLHVEEVYLDGLKYKNLKLTFEDGCISDYNCTNFEDQAANKRYIKENLMFNHDSLPLGEFAIGTNTTAYVMANKYGIVDILPILIVEKMGPHFAVGDTCYSRREDHAVFNPDGKEIIARDNEKTLIRKEDENKAYFNCHTDITIPYDALGEITAYREDDSSIELIKDGRFVLAGTEFLNEAFKA